MARIRLEFVPVSWLALGWLGFDHLQLVFEPDGASSQDDWYVIEGNSGRSPFGLVVHVTGDDGRTTLAAANLATGAALVAKIGTPETRGSVVLPVVGDPQDAWDRMAAYARAINGGRLPYWCFGLFTRSDPVVNSSSVVASLLWAIGIDVHEHLPAGLGFSPGTDTLLSGGLLHGLPAGVAAFDTLVGGDGNDDLRGSDDPRRMEKLYGGRGNDTFHWTPGFSYVHGGQPGLAVSEDGYDTMDYRGAGRVEVRRGRRALLSRRPDYVVAFSGGGDGRGGGIDLLTSIERLLLDGLTDVLALGPKVTSVPRRLDIEFRGAGAEQESARLDLSRSRRGVTVEAHGQDRAEMSLGMGRGGKVWGLSGVRHLTGTAYDDHIQMTPSMHVVEGGAGDDVIDARLVTPGGASRWCGYDAEIDGGAGDDILIACRGRTFARGGTGCNTFVVPRLGEPGARLGPELVIADAKPGDCLLVPQGGDPEERAAKTRLTHVSGVMGACARGISAWREADDLVLSVAEGPGEGPADLPASRSAMVRLLHFHNGDMGITHPAFD